MFLETTPMQVDHVVVNTTSYQSVLRVVGKYEVRFVLLGIFSSEDKAKQVGEDEAKTYNQLYGPGKRATAEVITMLPLDTPMYMGL